jgi:hypothetical protein
MSIFCHFLEIRSGVMLWLDIKIDRAPGAALDFFRPTEALLLFLRDHAFYSLQGSSIQLFRIILFAHDCKHRKVQVQEAILSQEKWSIAHRFNATWCTQLYALTLV